MNVNLLKIIINNQLGIIFSIYFYYLYEFNLTKLKINSIKMTDIKKTQFWFDIRITKNILFEWAHHWIWL